MSCFANELFCANNLAIVVIDNINITQLPFECNFAAKGGKMSVYPLCHQTSTGRLIDKYDSFFVIIRVEYEYPGGGGGFEKRYGLGFIPFTFSNSNQIIGSVHLSCRVLMSSCHGRTTRTGYDPWQTIRKVIHKPKIVRATGNRQFSHHRCRLQPGAFIVARPL